MRIAVAVKTKGQVRGKGFLLVFVWFCFSIQLQERHSPSAGKAWHSESRDPIFMYTEEAERETEKERQS